MTTKRKPKPEPESIAHRQYAVNDGHAPWCREVVNFDDRHDSVPVLHGVRVGQYWRNIHVHRVERVVEIRLAGLGTHTAHYETILLCEEGADPYDQFNISGQSLQTISDHWELVELVGEEWVRVEPQPYTWVDDGDARENRANGTYRSERAYVSRVRHDRPAGEPLFAWEGQRRTLWAMYDNVVTCDGLVLTSVRGHSKKHVYKQLIDSFPFAKPSSASMRKVLPAAMSSS